MCIRDRAQQPVGHLVGSHGEGAVVTPPALDVQVPLAKSLLTQAELGDHPQARGVLGPDGDLHPVQAHRAEAVVDGEGNGRRGDPSAGDVLADPVPDAGRAQGAADDGRHRELADELTAVRHRERQRGARAGLLGQGPHEAAEAGRWAGRPFRGRRLPRVQPGRVARPQGQPGGCVTAAQRAQDDIALAQHNGPAARHLSSPAPGRPPRRRRAPPATRWPAWCWRAEMARGWPVVLREGDVVLRALRRRDASAWLALRARNAAWLDPWEATSPERPTGPPPSFGRFVRTLSEQARAGTALPFAMAYRGELVGQLTVSTIVRGSLCSASIGYWISEHVAGRGITPTAVALAVDHCLGPVGLHPVSYTHLRAH